MSQVEYRLLNLSFISSKDEIKRQITNTAIFSFIEEEFQNVLELSGLLESTQYGYNAPALDSGQNKFLRISDIKEGKVIWENVPYCDCSDEKSYLLYSDDILVARTGGTTGKSFLIKNPPQKSIFAGYLIRLRANKKILPEFLNLFLNSYVYWSQISEMKSGSAQPNVNAEKLKKLLVPYCSLEIQGEILNVLKGIKPNKNIFKRLLEIINVVQSKYERNCELEELFTQQQAYVTKLRQAILQDAVQGKLVPQNPKDEPASELLKRIKGNALRLVHGENVPFNLPETWMWTRLEDISANIHYGFNASANTSKMDFRLLRITDIQENKVNWENVPGCIISKKEAERYKLFENDILIARTGGTIGKSYIVKDLSVDAVFASYLIRVIPSKLINADYLKLFIESPLYWKQLIALSSGTGQPNVNGTSLKSLITPLPPLLEQKRIVTKVEQLMTYCDELEQSINQSQKQAEQLLQAVLKEAFEQKGTKYKELKEELTIAAEPKKKYAAPR
ncbi:MAG TPA: restriction endonuclease subunit S [Bacteroidia bacterium]|jgi:type I restriction enzyme S subunit|nr:restriction endonuclease subunit S [Bacteroidia bacterium]